MSTPCTLKVGVFTRQYTQVTGSCFQHASKRKIVPIIIAVCKRIPLKVIVQTRVSVLPLISKYRQAASSSCYSTLAMLRKLKNILPFNLRKNIVQALVLSKLYYNDVIYHSLPDYLQKRLQGVQKADTSFVVGKYASLEDGLSLKWLPIKEQREWNMLKIGHKALYNTSWPHYLRLNVYKPSRVLRSSNSVQLQNSATNCNHATGLR